jgi:hypothetical protein
LHTILNVVDNGKKNLDRAVSLAVLWTIAPNSQNIFMSCRTQKTSKKATESRTHTMGVHRAASP